MSRSTVGQQRSRGRHDSGLLAWIVGSVASNHTIHAKRDRLAEELVQLDLALPLRGRRAEPGHPAGAPVRTLAAPGRTPSDGRGSASRTRASRRPCRQRVAATECPPRGNGTRRPEPEAITVGTRSPMPRPLAGVSHCLNCRGTASCVDTTIPNRDDPFRWRSQPITDKTDRRIFGMRACNAGGPPGLSTRAQRKLATSMLGSQ